MKLSWSFFCAVINLTLATGNLCANDVEPVLFNATLPEGALTELTAFNDEPSKGENQQPGAVFIPVKVCMEPEDGTEADLETDSKSQPVCWSYSDATSENNGVSDSLPVFRQQQAMAALFFSSFLFIRVLTDNRYAPPLVNALISAPVGVYLYLSQEESLSDIIVNQPAIDYQLENTVPLVLYGYAGYEILDSLHAKKWLTVLHGSTVFAACATSHYAGKMRMAVYGLVVETSQIFLNAALMQTRHYKLATPSAWLSIPFIGSFYITRWAVFPYEYARFIRDSFWNKERYQQDPVMISLIVAGGMIVNMLNFGLGILIMCKVKKILRKYN